MLLRDLRSDHEHAISASCPKEPAPSATQLDAELPFNLHPVRVTDVLRNVQASAMRDRAISITLAVDESVYVNADETLLTLAVSSLLHNAIKSSGVGARITLSCQADEDGVVVEVEDEDDGLPEHESPRQSLRFNGSEAGEPRGLRLAIAQRTVAAMAGRLSFEDRPNHGCTFRLRFPPLSALALASRDFTHASCASRGDDQAAALAADRL